MTASEHPETTVPTTTTQPPTTHTETTRGDAATKPRAPRSPRPTAPVRRLGTLRKALVFLVLASGVFLGASEYLALNTALGSLAHRFDASEAQLALIVAAFGLALAGFGIPGGRFGDRVGRRSAFALGLLVLAGGAIWAARAGTTTQLIAARGVMGLGAAMETPCFLAVLHRLFETEAGRRRIAMSYSGVVGVGVVTGPVLGGLLISRYGVEWIFYGTALVAAAAMVSSWVVPQSREPGAQRTDFLGAVLVTGGLGGALWGVIEGPSDGWRTRPILAALSAGGALLLLFVWRQAAAKSPLIDRAFVRNPRFWAAAITIIIGYAIAGGTLFLLSPQLQSVFGYGPFQAGVRLLPAAGGAIIGSLLALPTERRVRASAVLAVGFALLAGAEFWLYRAALESGYRPLAEAMVLAGLGWGLLTARMSAVVMDVLPGDRASAAAAVDQSVRQTALIIGVAVVSTLVNLVYRTDIAPSLRGIPAPLAAAARSNVAAATEAGAPSALAEAARVAYTNALHRVALVFALGAVATVVFVLLVASILRVRARVSRRRRPGPVATSPVPEETRATTSLVPEQPPAALWSPDPIRARERELLAALQNTSSWPRSSTELAARIVLLGRDALASFAEEGRPVVPVNLAHDDQRALELAGVRFGPPVPGEALFQQATFPQAWELVHNKRGCRLELRDGDGLVRAVILYEASLFPQDRWATMALAVRASQPATGADRSIADADAVRREEAESLNHLEEFPSTLEGLDTELTNAGLQALVKLWARTDRAPALLPANEGLDGELRRLGFLIGDRLAGDDLFMKASPPPGWKPMVNPTAQRVDVFDDVDRLRAVVMYSTTAHGDRWACTVLPEANP